MSALPQTERPDYTETRSQPTVDLNTVQMDVWHLFHLIDAAVSCLGEMPFDRDGGSDAELERVAALSWIARDLAERIGQTIEDNFHSIQRR